MLGGGDYISFILQPEEEEVFALWSLASCSYTVPLHCRDWGKGRSYAKDKSRKETKTILCVASLAPWTQEGQAAPGR